MNREDRDYLNELEEIQGMLKNALVKRVQRDPKWADEVLDSLGQELDEVVTKYFEASVAEAIGPKDFILLLTGLRTKVKEAISGMQTSLKEEDSGSLHS